MHPAPADQERVWKGLERFVNCDDSEQDYRALGLSFPDFWPVGINAPDAESGDVSLDWHPVCYKLFLFYRDRLRRQWEDAWEHDETGPELFIGHTDWNEKAIELAKYKLQQNKIPSATDTFTFGQMVRGWWEILSQFPEAYTYSDAPRVRMIWTFGNIYFDPQNSFESAFLMLFRQSWRARVCPRCKAYFVARKPKQKFCGTACSAGSRLASNRGWWKRTGAKRRAKTRAQKARRRRKRKR